jgi:hypothetical protein
VRGLALVVLVASCDLVYDLDRPTVRADVDRDGVPDADDNCPATANPSQNSDACACRGAETDHDEDADSIDDACDNCPHVANTEQLNTDGDHLGDACDDELDSLECILYFDPFTRTPTAVMPPVGQWASVGDDFVQAETTTTRTIFMLDLIATSPRVDTAFRFFGGVPTTSGGFFIGIDRDIVTSNPTLPLGVSNLISQQLDAVNSIVVSSRISDPNGNESNPLASVAFGPPVLLEPNTRGVLSVSARDGMLRSRGTIGDSTGTFTVASGPTSGFIALRTVRMSLAFEYLFVADRAAALPCP